MLQEKALDEFLVRNHAEEGDEKCVSKIRSAFVENALPDGVVLDTSVWSVEPRGSEMSESGPSESPIARLKSCISNALLDRSIVLFNSLRTERGDVPGWVLVVLMTTGLVTGIWTLAAPRIDSILRDSLDSMNGIR